ncbi:MAG: flagellar hook-basal body complex protein FliE [Deltaproteobacteria bacterium]|jgi:flagellar hook-basal body complex protein FliE|nr:flagellar hook-basal body complex protein FliE [Deltaproteobacteria bacterium]MCL5892317.1 flagellar hook-basal body complex protein FliE [Deltaproteobacteria bacterium]
MSAIIINNANNLNPGSIKELNPNNIAGGASQAAGSSDGGSFANTLLNYIDKVNNLQEGANNQASAIATGQSSNIHQAMIDMEKANNSFELMMQVRNKIITAYNQIINMQV